VSLFLAEDSVVSLILLPVLIFIAEMIVVTLGTVRIIFVAQGRKYLAPLLGFFEVAIWLYAITQIMQNLNRPTCFLAFAAGFAVGNFLGIRIESKLAMGTLLVRIISKRDTNELTEGLRTAQYGVTRIEGEGATGPVQIVFTVIQRRELERVIAIIKRFDPRAFYSVDGLQEASAGIFPATRPRLQPGFIPTPLMRLLRVSR
jgi:uncharacterized protein YebE (UPF0316 family)